MRFLKASAAVLFTLIVFVPPPLMGQVDPSMTIYDSQGTPFTSKDNSTVFTASPGAQFVLEVAGAPFAPFGLFLSMKTTPFPTNIVPPPLFIMPPILPVIAGPNAILKASGILSFTGVVPSDFSGLGYDVNLYLQAFVQDPVNGFQLTNGIRMKIISPQYKADLAVGQGALLNQFTDIGRLTDPDAGDNQLPPGGGKDLLNGESIVPDPDITPSTYGFMDDSPPPTGTPTPANSIYLNGRFPLVPGDAGIDDRYLLHAGRGSSLHIHTRDRICRNNENENLQYIIVPIFDEQGKKTHDLNVYHFRDADTNEFLFVVLDVLNNDFYELSGTRLTSNNAASSESPWDPNVSISPDGVYMAAVQKDRTGDYTGVVEHLHIIKLQKGDVWSTGLHARKVKLNDPQEQNFKETRIFAETLTFAGESAAAYPYTLFFATNKYSALSLNPMKEEPPIEHPSVLWSLNPNAENGKGFMHKFNDAGFPMTEGGKYQITYYGLGAEYLDDGFKRLNELVWLTSEDHKTICLRAAGRYAEWDNVNKEWIRGEWSWEILCINKILGPQDFTIKNITQFEEQGEQGGVYIAPFGQAHDGHAQAALNPEGSVIAFVGQASVNPLKDNLENLYFGPTDGSKAGVLFYQPLTSSAVFKDQLLPPPSDPRGREILDPYFVNNEDLLFFCGKGGSYILPYFPPKMDLFLYRNLLGEFRNLTNTAGELLPDPPVFTKLGDIRPAGMFSSRDGRYVFFFRGHTWDFFPVQTMNLVGIDTANDFTLFNLSGSEFGSGFIPDLANGKIGSIVLGPELNNLILVPTENTDLLFFTALYDEHKLERSYQVFMVNLNFPLTAIPVTSFDPVLAEGMIDNLVADSAGKYIAFSRSKSGDAKDLSGAYEKVFVVDLSHGAYTRDLTPAWPNYDRASIDGSFFFIPSPSAETPGELIYGLGIGGQDHFANNPPGARIWLYPLESVADPSKPSVSYPLTESDFFLLFNALPYDG